MASDLYDTDFLARLTVRRLAELNKTRAKVEALERRAGALADAEAERRRLAVLGALADRYATLGPALRDMGGAVAELKAYLQSVYDADLLGDSVLQELATGHAVGYCVRLLESLAEPTGAATKGSLGVLELATSTLAMFASRPAAARALADAGAVPLMVRLLSPLFPTVAVVNVANAVGNLAGDSGARLSFRAGGGVGALVRLLRPDVDATAQTASAAALSLLAARDMVIQDSVRYLGGIDHLVDLLASRDAYLAEVARYALLALRHGNVKNQAEIITAIRASSALAKDVRRLDAAAELLRFEDGTPVKAPAAPSSEVRSLIYEMTDYAHSSAGTALLTATRPRTADSTFRASSTAASAALRASYNASPTRPLLTRDYAHTLVGGKDSLLSPLGSPSASALGSDSGGAGAASLSGSPPSPWKISALVEVESELLRKKHLARFTPDELALLLEEMGFDSLDLRGFRVHRVSGAALLDMGEDDMVVELVLPRSKVRKLRALQRAAALFDRIATLPRQGKISEVELRLYLAGQGAGSADVNKVVRLFRTLVRTDRYDFVTFWDFVTAYDWIAQALRIYGVPA
mmetsp:Transcript_27752/g.70743  ORF Transcript_27752/g.70743 Transcript_27752/m.70743 type:complete len:579 (-) Transcript_27752:845-2581(-)|eukprot:CAMPEP_0202859402 /NCGR_PEP_ID=MMETSP1391-20130828/1532_1 /ASSEMBLY_ACC=CAM_ASM_000867 /TAXON_ID=1034604 /ORGANISM="Chlamydomonas leiostraca, Strain SAG 11-49" /LENGTH=578 /DNA_ID=CAMNT_0049538435 /DNA_START=279 /DNA_END=2015 /DNA_ORIENTATION=+